MGHAPTKLHSSLVAYEFKAASSQSPTDIWIVEDIKTNKRLFAKVYIEPKPRLKFMETTGVQYEAQVYKYVLDTIINNPSHQFNKNFIRLEKHLQGLTLDQLYEIVNGDEHTKITIQDLSRNMAYTRCGEPSLRPALNQPDDNKDIKIDRKFPDCKQETEADILSEDRARQYTYAIILTHIPAGEVISLTEYLQRYGRNPTKRGIIGKTALVIRSMHSSGISHNDQHWRNILVQLGADDDTTVYDMDGKKYTFPGCPDRPLLFDWDRSRLADDTKKNLYIETEPDEFDGLYTPAFAPNRDWLTFVIYLHKTLPRNLHPTWKHVCRALFIDQYIQSNGCQHIMRILTSRDDRFAYMRYYHTYQQYMHIDFHTFMASIGFHPSTLGFTDRPTHVQLQHRLGRLVRPCDYQNFVTLWQTIQSFDNVSRLDIGNILLHSEYNTPKRSTTQQKHIQELQSIVSSLDPDIVFV